jgi:RluA family pseudouridine synthase
VIDAPAAGEAGALIPPARLRVDADQAGLRADAFLFAALPYLSRTRVRNKIQRGEILLNGKRHSSSTRLAAGDEITVRWRGLPDRAPAPPLPILYEDEVLLAVNKPAGVACHPMGKVQAGTVIQFARERDEGEIRARLGKGDTAYFPRLANRLDVFTSGIVLIARTRDTLIALQALSLSRGMVKEYIALVEGVLAGDEGRIDLPLRLDHGGAVRIRMVVHPEGLPSSTTWRVLRRMHGHTLLSVRLHSGRQHQIRAHLAAIGHPVVGDLLYKDEKLFLARDPALPQRHCLHAGKLDFPHPLTGEVIALEAPVPDDFLSLMAFCEQPPHGV